MAEKIKILIVDDSRVFRNVLEEALRGDGDIQVLGVAFNGVKAMEFIRGGRLPDLVTLDVEMPEMDGLATLQAIQQFNAEHPELPDVGVIMVSAHTRRGADVTISALEHGAFDFVTKPEGDNLRESIAMLHRQLIVKIRHFALKRLTAGRAKPAVAPPPVFRQAVRPVRITPYRAVLIGVSTGGPKALAVLLPMLSGFIDLPVLIVQHMPPTFTQSLADNLDKKCRHTVIEAKDNDVIRPGHIYIAPGGRHLVIRRGAIGQVITALNDQPPEKGCRPSVDVLFRAAAAIYGGDQIAVVLTGMGSDGTRGLGPLKKAGAHIIAQDEASSVVWGMPGSAVASGCVDEVLPLERIAFSIKELVGNGKS